MRGRLALGWELEHAMTAEYGQRKTPAKPRERKPRVLHLYEAFGERKTLTEWARDPRSKVASRQALGFRLGAGMGF